MLRRTALIIGIPVVLIFGYIVADELPLGLGSLFEDFGGPFLIATWIGLGFANAWDAVRTSMLQDRAGPKTMAVTGLLCALIFFMTLGPQTLIDDPWLFGVAIFPGIDMAMPLLRPKLDAFVTGSSEPETAERYNRSNG